jgi:acyl transferase domain-containing protein/3-hydroxymyristoyl/3-hydroxydecanoyl-(acyl carrier protein) dehydratase
LRYFPAIAVVGQGCVLPGALTPASLWDLVHGRRNAISRAREAEWRLPPGTDRSRLALELGTESGGYVEGFEQVFDPSGFDVPLEGLDPVFLWTLHAAREALRAAGLDGRPHPRGVLVLGNLGYPVPELAKFALEVWEGGSSRRGAIDARNRFMSGLPAQLAARALGLGLGGFALDAACASSLYAIKLACDRLQDGTADLALAGGVNHADSLFLHLGFTALSAQSPTGQSRPFHRDADGLVAAHGAALVALKRLEDAEAAGDRIFGVIRGVGLSNDGRGKGLLVPAEAGQVRAMRAAYAMSGISPREISLVECHATGTAVGDATEVRSLHSVFDGAHDLPLGSLKSNLGHLVTAAGAAGLIKVLGAFAAGVLPATLNAEAPLAELENTPFRLLHEAEPWLAEGQRRAAVSAFGFGGNNAHLIVEEYARASSRSHVPSRLEREHDAIAVIAQTVTIGKRTGEAEFERALFEENSPIAVDPAGARALPFELDIARLRFPPADLKAALPQQTLLLRAALELDEVLARLPAERTTLIVGMQCDAEIARSNLRWRRPGAAAGASTDGPLSAALVVGCMPNIVANRLGTQLGFEQPTFTVAADEASGTIAFDLALRSLSAGESDAAVVGAVDLSVEPVHEAAAVRLLPADRRVAADAAVLLVLKRLSDARRDGERVLAVIDSTVAAPAGLELRQVREDPGLSAVFGHSHAASGLLHVAAATAACERRAMLRRGARAAMPFLPTGRERRARVEIESLGGFVTRTTLRSEPPTLPRQVEPTRLAVFGAPTLEALRRALQDDERTRDPEPAAFRVAIAARDEAELGEKIRRAAESLGSGTLGDGVYFGSGKPEGELAFVFTGPAGAYPHMGRELALALPELIDALAGRMTTLRDAAGWLYDEEPDRRATPLEKLWGSSYLMQLHSELTRGVLDLRPAAAIGYCSGETNALFALGAWDDLDGFRRAIDDHAVYDRELSGELRCLRRAWGLPGDVELGWSVLRVRAPLADIRRAVEAEPRVHLTIVNAPGDAIIAGEPAGCARVASALGAQRVRSLDYDFVMHCPEARGFSAQWRALHHRPTLPVPGVRFYTHATLSSYSPNADSVADALTGQAMNPIDFPALIERAYRDGVRVFVEHGPHAGCTGWIDAILGARPHLAVALDRYGVSSMYQAADSAARLVAAGVRLEHARLTARLTCAPEPCAPAAAPPARWMQFPSHLEPVRMAEPGPAERMIPAPVLPIFSDLPTVTETALAVHQRGLADAHRAYLRHQAATHGLFLRLMLPPPSARAPLVPPAPSELPAPPKVVGEGRAPSGPRFDRAALEVLASGKISSVFGASFEKQDGYARQVRMPEPPLLLADRVLGIEGQPGEMGLGTIWTETDVTADAWYLHQGRMPAGIVIESGQADLLLISWLGVDFHNRGERVYRLLGCELTCHGELPRIGDTLRYEIHVDGHAIQGDVRLFFFHYDCRVNGALRVTVRGGQAGFFTDEELAASAGILWSAEEAEPTPVEHARLDPPRVRCTKRRFTAADIDALGDGRGHLCFGPGFERLASHTLTPDLQGGRMRLLDEVTDFDPEGGPWGRGYLRARLALSPEHWFFRGHFKNDPCMPGTLMFEACVQALSLYLAALGHTLDRDGYRFEPVTDVAYSLRCRGQALPTSKEVVYEVFIDELSGTEPPTVFADVLGSVDGRKAFHCRRMGLRLVPAWPMDPGRLALPATSRRDPVARSGGFEFDQRSLLAAALGRPSEAFGPTFAMFDGLRRTPRLPGPPYHFMSRVTRVQGSPGGMQVGSSVDVAYDVPRDAWYFGAAARRVMPFAVLLEVALQPCGWLAMFVGCAQSSETDLVFRNLDGTGTVHRDVDHRAGTLITTATLKSLSTAGGLIIVGFDVAVRAGDALVYSLDTVFGFFTADVMKNQVGLPTTASELAKWDESNQALEPPIADGMLRMIDRVSGYWPDGGEQRLGRVRAEKHVDPGEWFFKAHFFQDPVQPGSLGLEALLQTLQAGMLLRGLDAGIARPVFEPIALGVPLTWKYRGQVVPESGRVVTDLEFTEIRDEPLGRVAVASGSLWVDGKRIYEVRGLGVRVQSSSAFDRDRTKAFWRRATGVDGGWAGEDLLFALLDRFVGRVHVEDESMLAARRGVPALYLANHQVAVETILAALVIGGLTDTVPTLPAKTEHRHTWVGELMHALTARQGLRDPRLLRFVDRNEPASVLALRDELESDFRNGRSALIHVEGTRATTCRHRVTTLSSVFLDLAIGAGIDVIPVRFVGGLPVEPSQERLEFPFGYGKQDYWFGKPISAAELRQLPFAARTQRVLRAVNELGGMPENETPSTPAPELARTIEDFMARHGVSEPRATLAVALAELDDPSAEGRALVAELHGAASARDDSLSAWFRGR